MKRLQHYREELDKALQEVIIPENPRSLYDPIRYILSLGGKRLRPVLTLMTCDFFNADFKSAIPAALAMELFHNFSLIHDDIMDEAPLRRGKETVHHKWDTNTGILSGDAMLILAYQLFEAYEPEKFRALAKLFSQTALQVCEGQQLDMDFETKNNVTIADYLKMIEYKTAVLLAASMKMGAIVGGGDTGTQQKVYDFGKYLGIAFQLQDDYLDAFGNPETFGKQIGGDIIENKKTYLYLKALNFGTSAQKAELRKLFNEQQSNQSNKIVTVKQLFTQTGAAQATQEAIKTYTQRAFDVLDELPFSQKDKEFLRHVGETLLRRNV